MKKIIDENVDKIVKEGMLSYGNYIITNRALPSLEDGLKPVYRRILYTMHKMGATKFTKSQNVEGACMKFHPHGGSYPTIVGMVQKDNNLTPLIEGKGNFAQHTSRDLQAGAGRYTEVKLSEISKDIFKGLNKNVVNWIPNYDDTDEIPEFLPVKFPNILHIAQEGIALGMSNKMPSFNINDICKATIEYIESGNKVILIPDFATGGKIIKDDIMFNKINSEGRGTIRIRGKAEIIGNTISITEIPYSTTREAIIEKIIKLVKSKELIEITGVKDLTGLSGMEIEITCKKNTNMEILLEKLYKLTPLEDTYSCNMNVLHNGLPKVMGTWEIIDKWINWRINCIENQLKGEVEKLSKEYHLLVSFEKIVDNVEKVVDIIRISKEEEIISELMKIFNLSEAQAEYISNIKLRNLNKEYIEKKLVNIKKLGDEIVNKEFIIEDKKSKLNIIVDDLKEVSKKFGVERRSKVIEVSKEDIKKVTKVIEEKDYNVTLFITEQGFIKKVTRVTGTHKLKPNDKIIHEFNTTNNSEVIIFAGTDAYKIKTSSLKDCKISEFGEYIPAMIDNKNIVGYSVLDNKNKFMLICYDNEKIAKVSLDSFRTTTNRKKLSNSLYAEANVVKIETFEEDKDITVIQTIRGKEKETVINTKDITLKTTRNTQGIKVLKNIKNFIK